MHMYYQKSFHFLTAFFQMVPAALEIAMEEDVEFRQGLPLDYLTYMGVQNSDKVINSRLFCCRLLSPSSPSTIGFSPITR